jgi:hypothetical protein
MNSVFTFLPMMRLGDFLRVRGIRIGLLRPEHIIVAAKTTYRLSRQNSDDILRSKDEADLAAKQPSSLDRMALTLRFDSWSDAIDAWRSNDLMRGLDKSSPPLIHDIPSANEALAKDGLKIVEGEEDVSATSLVTGPKLEGLRGFMRFISSKTGMTEKELQDAYERYLRGDTDAPASLPIRPTTDDGQTVRGGTRSAAHNTNDDPGLGKRKTRPKPPGKKN